MATPIKMYALLYSESQRYFHIETVAAMIDRNIRMYLDNRRGDYVTLAIGSTVEELREIKRQLVEKRADVAASRHLINPDE
ncbi:hypothetical protein ID86_27365 [Salmonella enterica subsp. enterica]|uniref:Uncharacterized protein n=1 Tax=Salmonella enterica subsp. enterica serovar Rough O:d:1,7 TaxID=1974323 RepID=A0A974QDS5_SALET|nr:hypothetical protein [Salmonella enterica subsp. enterica serovar Redlands]ECW2474268.1 hypothetical protein [Salmonella enterica subsp. enterica serovar Florida]OSD65752.1 hypothetical protein R537_22000 [Salmonella enterica subsp. enterica serovar Rough O:d:1,7]